MKIRVFLLCILATAAMAADLPYAGKWKVNVAKSDFGQLTVTMESLPGGEWQSTSFGVTYKFKMDGKEYPDGMGGTIAWKEAGANTWTAVSRANGKVTETDTFKLSADGKTLTQSAKQAKADGGSLEGTTVFERVSGGPSLAGKWKTAKVSGGASSVEFVASGGSGLRYHDLDMDMSCDMKLDGSDSPCTGPTIPPGFTAAVKNTGKALDLTVKKDGKVFFTATYTVSADGKTMTEIGGTSGTGEKMKIVWDRM
jgi:hypothetical protein